MRRWLDLVNSGGCQLRRLMNDLDPEIPPSLFTGFAGWAVVFHEVERIGLDYAADEARGLDLLRDCSHQTGRGIQGADTTEVLWEAAGIVA